MVLPLRALEQLRVRDLGEEHAELLAGLISSVDADIALAPNTKLSFLSKLYRAERKKGNASNLEQIEAFVVSVQTNTTAQKQASEQPHVSRESKTSQHQPARFPRNLHASEEATSQPPKAILAHVFPALSDSERARVSELRTMLEVHAPKELEYLEVRCIDDPVRNGWHVSEVKVTHALENARNAALFALKHLAFRNAHLTFVERLRLTGDVVTHCSNIDYFTPYGGSLAGDILQTGFSRDMSFLPQNVLHSVLSSGIIMSKAAVLLRYDIIRSFRQIQTKDDATAVSFMPNGLATQYASQGDSSSGVFFFLFSPYSFESDESKNKEFPPLLRNSINPETGRDDKGNLGWNVNHGMHLGVSDLVNEPNLSKYRDNAEKLVEMEELVHLKRITKDFSFEKIIEAFVSDINSRHFLKTFKRVEEVKEAIRDIKKEQEILRATVWQESGRVDIQKGILFVDDKNYNPAKASRFLGSRIAAIDEMLKPLDVSISKLDNITRKEITLGELRELLIGIRSASGRHGIKSLGLRHCAWINELNYFSEDSKLDVGALKKELVGLKEEYQNEKWALEYKIARDAVLRGALITGFLKETKKDRKELEKTIKTKDMGKAEEALKQIRLKEEQYADVIPGKWSMPNELELPRWPDEPPPTQHSQSSELEELYSENMSEIKAELKEARDAKKNYPKLTLLKPSESVDGQWAQFFKETGKKPEEVLRIGNGERRLISSFEEFLNKNDIGKARTETPGGIAAMVDALKSTDAITDARSLQAFIELADIYKKACS